MTSSTIDHQVIVLGAGPTGLTLANRLGQAGIDTLLVERNSTTSDMPKAVVLDDEGARTLATIGLADEAMAATLTASGAKYYDAKGRLIAEVGRGEEEFGYPKRNYFHQPDLEAILRRGLERHASVRQRFATTLTRFEQDADCVTTELASGDRSETVRAQFLIACDGGRSPTREALGISLEGQTYPQDWVVIDTLNDPMAGDFSRFICDPSRPTAIIPAPGHGRRYEFMLLPGESREEMLSPETLMRLLAPYRTYREDDILRAAIYTFHARIAAEWRRGRILLAGDAAHLTPPFAGQGMNAGLRDADNLAWKLIEVLSGRADQSILDSYELERRDPCWAMIMLAVIMGEVVMPTSTEQIAVRDAVLARLADFPEFHEYLLSMRFKPRPRYEQGLFASIDEPALPGSLVGAMIPNPRLQRAGGESCLLDDVLGDGFALLAQDDDGEAWIRHEGLKLFARFEPASFRLDWAENNAASGESPRAMVQERQVGAPLLAHRDQVLLIRPDRYVAGAFAPADAKRFRDAFARKLQAI